jgi:hypothetical protein
MSRAAEAYERARAAQRSPVFSEVDAASAEARPLGDSIAIEWVVIRCPRWNDDGTANAVEIVYGDKGRQRFDLLPGNSSDPLPFKDLSEVRVKTLPNPDDGSATALRVPFYYMPKQ